MPSRAKKCSMMFPKPTPHLEDHPSEWLTTLMIVSPVRLCFPPSKWVFCMAYIQGLHPNNFICVPRKLETWLHLWQNMSKSKWKTSSWGKPPILQATPIFLGAPCRHLFTGALNKGTPQVESSRSRRRYWVKAMATTLGTPRKPMEKIGGFIH